LFTNSSAVNRPSYTRTTGEVVVTVDDVSVKYQIPTERVNSLKETVIRRLRRRRTKYNDFWALRGVSLQVRQGEAIAFVGPNGAGKSTLLKVIARVQRPTDGRVIVRGNVSPMIELGAGFHPELTGRENVYVNGALLGFSRRHMRRKFDGIVEFAELERFIDAPLRTYSSGMIARLGFAIAADADPDILIIDEALAVGDEAFQQKCIARMNDFREQGVTIFFVTHALNTIEKLCPRAAWLEGGEIRGIGPTKEVIAAYRKKIDLASSLAETQKLQIVLPVRR
jgi:ABC-2 type transport system ATP-binding protein